jgi:hypothetical protein
MGARASGPLPSGPLQVEFRGLVLRKAGSEEVKRCRGRNPAAARWMNGNPRILRRPALGVADGDPRTFHLMIRSGNAERRCGGGASH